MCGVCVQFLEFLKNYFYSAFIYVCAPPVCLLLIEFIRGCELIGNCVTDGCELPYELLDLNLGPLQEQQVLKS